MGVRERIFAQASKNKVAPLHEPEPEPEPSSSSEYGSEYETDSSEAATPRPGSRAAAVRARLSGGEDKPADDGFTALSQIRACERCSQPQSRSRQLARCSACEQAICGDCNAISVSAFPGSLLCLDCLEEHGERLVDVTDGADEDEEGAVSGFASDGTAVTVPAEVVKLFQELDEDGSGSLEAFEIGQLAARLGTELSGEDIAAAMKEMDKSNDGAVDMLEFGSWWARQQAAAETGEAAGVMGSAVGKAGGRVLGGIKTKMLAVKTKRNWGKVRNVVVTKEKFSMKRAAEAAMGRARRMAFTIRHPIQAARKMRAAAAERKAERIAKEEAEREERLNALLDIDNDEIEARLALLDDESPKASAAGEEGEDGDGEEPDEDEDEKILVIYHVFRQFDKDDSGFIDATELQKVMVKQGEAVTNKEAKAILERMDDIEHDGLISFEEFYQVMLKHGNDTGEAIETIEDAVKALVALKEEIYKDCEEQVRKKAKEAAHKKWKAVCHLPLPFLRYRLAEVLIQSGHALRLFPARSWAGRRRGDAAGPILSLCATLPSLTLCRPPPLHTHGLRGPPGARDPAEHDAEEHGGHRAAREGARAEGDAGGGARSQAGAQPARRPCWQDRRAGRARRPRPGGVHGLHADHAGQGRAADVPRRVERRR